MTYKGALSMKKGKTSRKPSIKNAAFPVASLTEVSPAPAWHGQPKSKTATLIVALAVIIFAVLAVNKGMIVAAVVNGRPIFRWTLTNTLISKYGKQTLENMISEQLIAVEAKKSNIVVTKKEIDDKETEVLKSFGEKVSLEEVLKFQGMTKEDFDGQVKLQLLVTKLLGKDIAPMETEITDFIDKNRASMSATDEAGLREEAKTGLIDQKIGEKIQPWFTEVRSKAKILRFL